MRDVLIMPAERPSRAPANGRFDPHPARVTIVRPTLDALLLNPMTVGPVVRGFLLFRAEFEERPGALPRGAPPERTTLLFLEMQQHRLDTGAIDGGQFAAAVKGAIGDTARNIAFAGLAFWGGPVRCAPQHRFSGVLRLTVSQRRRARAIYRHLHAGIAAERAATHELIRAELTARQIRLLEDPCSSWRAGLLETEASPVTEAIAEYCALQADQQARLAALCTWLETKVRVRHARARARFLRLLGAAQRHLLDVIENVSPGLLSQEESTGRGR